MSGICGIVNFDGRPADAEIIRLMAEAGRHRGPDGVDFRIGDTAAMAFLSSQGTAESAGGTSSIASGDTWAVAADARFDNRESLIRRLDARSTPHTGDAALLQAAYIRYGPDCFKHLTGNFAFAVWDGSNRCLFAGRDVMGMRPFYFKTESNRLIFASEIRQILAVPGVERTLYRPMAAAWMLAHSGDPSWTFYDGISRLPPGCTLIASADGARISRPWDVNPQKRIRYRTDDEYADHFREIFRRAVLARIRSGRPAGVFLSGGLDSCSVAGMIGWLAQNDSSARLPSFQAYSYRFDSFPECDERYISADIAAAYGFPVHDIPADEAWTPGYFLEHPPPVDSPVTAMYRPLHDCTLRLARKSGVRVVFSGGSGDNMMGGFLFDHRTLLRTGRLVTAFRDVRALAHRRGTPFLRTAAGEILRPELSALASRLRLKTLWKLTRPRNPNAGPRSAIQPPEWMSPALLGSTDLETVAGLIAPPSPYVDEAASRRYRAVFDYFATIGTDYNELNHARFGIEYEDPWSDREIIEFVCAVPQYVLNRVDEHKRLTRLAMKGVLPENVRNSASKILPASFGSHALRTKESTTLEALSSRMAAQRYELLDEKRFSEIVTRFKDGGSLHGLLWPTLTLEAWLRAHFP